MPREASFARGRAKRHGFPEREAEMRLSMGERSVLVKAFALADQRGSAT